MFCFTISTIEENTNYYLIREIIDALLFKISMYMPFRMAPSAYEGLETKITKGNDKIAFISENL